MNFRAMTEPYTLQDEKCCIREMRRFVHAIAACATSAKEMPEGVPVTDELRYLAYNDLAEISIRHAKTSCSFRGRSALSVAVTAPLAVFVSQWGRGPKQADQSSIPSGIELLSHGLRIGSAIRNPFCHQIESLAFCRSNHTCRRHHDRPITRQDREAGEAEQENAVAMSVLCLCLGHW